MDKPAVPGGQPEALAAEGAADPGPVSLVGNQVVLVPVQPTDHQFLYWLANLEEISYRWRYRGAVLPFDAFVQQLNQGVFAQFVVHTRTDNERVGHVVAYGGDLRHGHVYVGNICVPDRIGSHVGAEAQIVFIDYLFALWNLRKIYIEVPEFTYAQIKQWIGQDLFSEEGCLRDHTFYKGRFWDQHVLAVYADAWSARSAVGDWRAREES